MAKLPKVERLKDAQGAGDVVAFFTHKLGIETHEDCGCDQRREALNARFPFKELRESLRAGKKAK